MSQIFAYKNSSDKNHFECVEKHINWFRFYHYVYEKGGGLAQKRVSNSQQYPRKVKLLSSRITSRRLMLSGVQQQQQNHMPKHACKVCEYGVAAALCICLVPLDQCEQASYTV